MASALLAFPARIFASLRKHRNYRLYFAGQVVSLTGTWMQDTALPWLIVERTHSPVAVGLLLFCRYVPFTLFGLFAGLLADRFDNRRFLMLTQASSLVVAAALAAVTLAGEPPLAVFYVLAFLGGAAVVFDAPSRHALTVQLVGRNELPNAVALNSSLFNAARVVGPAAAGVIIAAAGAGICFVIDAASFLAVLTALALMRPAELYPLDRGEAPPRGVAAIREGIAYVARDERLRLIIGSADRGRSRAADVAALPRRRHGLQRRDGPARARADRLARGRAPVRDRRVLLALDGVVAVDPPTDRARPAARSRPQPLPLRLRGADPARQPPRRMARVGRRHGAGLPVRGHSGPRGERVRVPTPVDAAFAAASPGGRHRRRRAAALIELRAPADDLDPPGAPRREQLVGVDLVGPADEVPRGIVLGASVDRGAPGVDPGPGVIPALERREPLLDRRSLCVPFPHLGSIAGR